MVLMHQCLNSKFLRATSATQNNNAFQKRMVLKHSLLWEMTRIPILNKKVSLKTMASVFQNLIKTQLTMKVRMQTDSLKWWSKIKLILKCFLVRNKLFQEKYNLKTESLTELNLKRELNRLKLDLDVCRELCLIINFSLWMSIRLKLESHRGIKLT